MRRLHRYIVVAASLFLTVCRTAIPPGRPVEPLRAASAEEAMRELIARRDSFRGARSLMRVRAAVKGETRSFRSQLQVTDGTRARLIVYTPIGTTALTVIGDGDEVTMEGPGRRTVGNANDLASSIGLVAGNLTLAQLGMLILGLPPREDLIYETTETGLRRAVAGDVVATFEPPVHPPLRVVLTRGADRVEIDHEEIVSE
jgi:outer membrane biogenesis lipoprotein LolB